MIIFYQKKFLKDLAWIPSPLRKKIEDFVFKELPAAANFSHVKGVENMTGYPHYYKIRFGDYRLGIHYENGSLTVERILHRREIYRYFP
jgi:mRNA interferase RelE/StbE